MREVPGNGPIHGRYASLSDAGGQHPVVDLRQKTREGPNSCKLIRASASHPESAVQRFCCRDPPDARLQPTERLVWPAAGRARRLAQDTREYIALVRLRLHELAEAEPDRVSAWCDWAEDWSRRNDPTLNPSHTCGIDDERDRYRALYERPTAARF